MEKAEALDLIDGLGGDEHTWVDYKSDYEIGGIPRDKAEFIRDVSSMANTITEKSRHYIIVGVNDDGNIVGIAEGRKDYRGEGPRHIFSYDESSIQQIVDSNLAPGPELKWFTYEEGGNKFGILTIGPLESPPCVTTQHIDEDDIRHLHKGVIFVRVGSGKKIAGREEVQKIINYRIQQQRERILEGVHRAVQIGPEWIERLSDALPEDSGVPITGVEDPDDADLEITQRLTREPASTLDEQLNEDIAQWKYRGDDFIEAKPLWQYYANPNTLTLDETAIMFLTHSALKNYALGGFWLMEADPSERRSMAVREGMRHHRAESAASLLLLLDDEDGFHELMDKSRTNSKYGFLSTCEDKFGNTITNRVNFLLEDGEYDLQHDIWRKNFDVRDFDVDEIRQFVPDLAEQLVDIQENMKEYPSLGSKLESFRNALWDLEAVFVGAISGDYKQ